MLSHIVPYNEARVPEDQPWLTADEREHAKVIGTDCLHDLNPDMEPWLADHLEAMASEGDQDAIGQVAPFCHFILTSDFRIVQEPNFLRWAIFLERCSHRVIDLTQVCQGREHSVGRYGAPSLKPEETWVSTIFSGLDEHDLFETMIFGGLLDHAAYRSSALLDAKKCHWEAVSLAHDLKRHMKRYGRSFRKDWIRLAKFWRLASLRGDGWVRNRGSAMGHVFVRLSQVPGPPPIPQPTLFHELCQTYLPRPTLAKPCKNTNDAK